MIPSSAYRDSLARFLAPISSLMADPTVGEIMINGPADIWVERRGIVERSDCSFNSADALTAALTNIAQYAGRPLSHENPILEAHLPDGSRVEAVLAPIAESGPVVAIRRFSKTTLTIEQLVKWSALTEEAAAFLARVVQSKHNMVISGGTGTGKTSLLGALSSLIRDNERIVVIEDTREVQLQKNHVVYLETRSADEKGRGRITIRDLLRATLRLRPDRIVVGEVRGKEALDLLQAMTSGHGGSMTTAHANSPDDALRRLETMAMMADTGMPLTALRAQVASAIQVIVQVERTADGRRRVSEISYVGKLTAEREYTTHRIFSLNESGCLEKRPPRKGKTT